MGGIENRGYHGVLQTSSGIRHLRRSLSVRDAPNHAVASTAGAASTTGAFDSSAAEVAAAFWAFSASSSFLNLSACSVADFFSDSSRSMLASASLSLDSASDCEDWADVLSDSRAEILSSRDLFDL